MLSSSVSPAQSFYDDCLEYNEPVFSEDPTLCELNSSFDEDRHINTIIKASELGVTVWPWYQSYFYNKDILITGTLIIDNQVAFYNCNVKFDNGGKILVTSGHLWAKYTDFFSCDDMWPGINCNSTTHNNRVDLYQSRIEDAQYALLPSANTNLIIIGTKFNRNHVGIKNGGSIIKLHSFAWNIFDCTSELSDPFSGQTPDPGEVSFAGIELLDCSATFGGPKANNIFRNMRHGLHTTGSMFGISKTKFISMQLTEPYTAGMGIYSKDGNFFVDNNCRFESNSTSGIYGETSSMRVLNSRFEENQFGIINLLFSLAQSTIVDTDTFIENSATSIRVDRDIASQGLHNDISNNVITGGDGTGQWPEIRIYADGVSEDELIVYNNKISFEDKTDPMGIEVWTTSADNTGILNNTITIKNESYESFGYGIRFNNYLDALGTFVYGNTVRGDGYNGNEAGSAIQIHGRNVTVCANTVVGLSKGLDFISTCDNSVIGLNHIDSSYVGLKANGVLGPQFRRGNTWATEENAFGLYGAQHTNPDFINMSRFIVHSASSIYWPDPFTPAGWFDGSFGDAPSCSEAVAPVDFTSFDTAVVEDALSLSPARLWSERRVLMYKLLRHPQLRDDIADFFDDGLDSIYGQFAIVDTLIRSSILNFRDEEELIDSLSLSINELSAEISLIDSLQEDIAVYGDSLGLINDSLAAVKSFLLDSISEIYSQVLSTRESVTEDRHEELLEVLEFNDEITPSEKWHGTQMVVNRYRIRTLMNETINENGRDSLREIAGMCIDEAGHAVYQAILLLPECEWPEYQDPEETVCPGEGQKRLYHGKLSDKVNVTLFPVPSSTYIEVSLTKAVSGYFEIYSVDGKRVSSISLADDDHLIIDVSNLYSGVFSWKLFNEYYLADIGSFVVIH